MNAALERGVARRYSPMARFRMSRDLLQADVAVRAGIHETIMSKIERGVRRPTFEQVCALAKALGTTRGRVRIVFEESLIWARGRRKLKAVRS